jgi:hypothetical protein
MSTELNSLIISICAFVILVATGIAASGLRTWQMEMMRGKGEYETDRRLLRATYKVRNAMGTGGAVKAMREELQPLLKRGR